MTRFSKFLALLGLSVALGNPCKALDLQFSFINDAGSGTAVGAIVTGRVLGLAPDPVSGYSFSKVTVYFDSVSTGFDPGFSADSWYDYGTFHLTGGVPDYASFSHDNGSQAIDLELNSRGLVFLSDYSRFYRNGEGDITWTALTTTPSATPDATSTLGLLVAGAVALETLRRRQARA